MPLTEFENKKVKELVGLVVGTDEEAGKKLGAVLDLVTTGSKPAEKPPEESE